MGWEHPPEESRTERKDECREVPSGRLEADALPKGSGPLRHTKWAM